jgi:AcrR family transcriptional regulator
MTVAAPPKQERSRKARDHILSTAVDVIHQEGARGFTVQRIATDARVSVASIYRYFVDKEGLLRATQDATLTAMADNGERRIRAADPTIESVVTTFVASTGYELQMRARAVNAFISLGRHDPEMLARAGRSRRERDALFREALQPQWDRIAHDDPDRAVRLAATFAVTPALQYAHTGANAEVGAEPLRSLYPQISRACIGYLVAPVDLSDDLPDLYGLNPEDL